MKILSAPYFALFSRNFYRVVSQTSFANAFKYISYLGLITTGLMLIMFFNVGVPYTDDVTMLVLKATRV